MPERQTFIVLPRMGQNFPKGKFQRRLCRRRMPLKAAKGFHWIVRNCLLCALIRGLQNLESSFIKGFNCCGGKMSLRCVDSRFAKPRSFPERERVYSFRVYEKNQKYTRGLRTSGLRGRFKALSEETSQKFPAAYDETGFAHKTPAKGFESVQKGYRSADARPLFFENELLYCELTVASGIRKRVAAR